MPPPITKYEWKVISVTKLGEPTDDDLTLERLLNGHSQDYEVFDIQVARPAFDLGKPVVNYKIFLRKEK